MEPRTVLTMSLLLVLAAASWALFFRAGEEARPQQQAAWSGIGYYARDARMVGTDDQGLVLYRVAATTIEQMSDDGGVNFRDVTVSYDPPGSRPWDLRADTGSMPPGSKIISLAGNVVARTRTTAVPQAIIRTDYLEFDTTTDVATTDREVDIDYAGSAVRATGLRASLAADRLELLSQVTGTYVP